MKQYFKQFKKEANLVISLIISIIFTAVLTLIDYYNLISKFFLLLHKPYVLFLFIAFVLILILCILHIHPLSQLKVKSITSLDILLYRFEVSLLLYLISSIVFCGYNWVKTGLVVGTIVGIFIFLIIRYIIFFKALKRVTNNENRIIDFKKVFKNKLPKDNSLPIFIDEKDVDYDLLDRQSIINKMVSSIKNYNTEGSYVIGLAGRWGSGKTTIINNVKAIIKKESNKTIVIDEFDPWLYENQDALLVAMFETIMKESGIKYSFRNLKKVCNIIKQVIGLTPDGELVSKALSIIAPKDNDYVAKVKDKINDFLTLNDKYVVVIIDNLERATAENVIFLFKLLGTLFDLKRITYILSYDKERLVEIFKDINKIDCRYIEKIIQQEIAIPIIQKSKCSEIYSTCCCNLLEYYKVPQSDIPSFKFIVEFLTNEIKDLRTFKRLINSTFAVVFTEDNYLFKPDLLALEIIRFYDSDLYYAIHKNRQFFISHDQILEGHIYFDYLQDKFNKEGKEFFNELLSDRSEYVKNLLASIFPFVNRFLKYGELILKNELGDIQYSSIQINGQVCSAKFFDLYFCYGANEYLAIKEGVKEFINICNGSIQLTDQLLLERLQRINYDYQEEWFSVLQLYIDKIKEDKLLVIIKFLTKNIESLDNTGVFLSVNALQRVTYIIYNFLKSCTDSNFNLYLEFMAHRYNRLGLLESLCSFFKEDRDKKMVAERAQNLTQLYENMCEEIISKDINIYDNDNYRVKNIWSLGRYLKEHSELISLQDYVAQILNKKTILRILGDIIGESISGTYNYYVSKELYEWVFGDNDIEELVNSAETITESQQFVKEVYSYYLNGTANYWGEKALSYNYPKRYRL